MATLSVSGNTQYEFQETDGTPYSFYPSGNQRPVTFVIGGNFGNAFDWTNSPAGNTVPYFSALSSQVGIKVLRENFNPNNYLNSTTATGSYRSLILAYAKNVIAAGMIPILCPQDFPTGASLAVRVTELYTIMGYLAQDFKGMPVWLETMNEPYVLGNDPNAWLGNTADGTTNLPGATSGAASVSGVRGVMLTATKIIRAIDPNAFVIVPAQGYSNWDTKQLAANPITDAESHVDLYDYHPYGYNYATLTSDSYAGPLINANLPITMGEYGCNSSNATLNHLRPRLRFKSFCGLARHTLA